VTGILGLLDPSGSDPEALRKAATAASYRGEVEIRSFGPVLLGIYARPPHESSFVEHGSSVFVADARVDAPLPGRVTERLSYRFSGDELLAAVLEESGPEALDGIAADFAVARWDSTAGELLLARDAFGLRPLFWARRGKRVAFAPDPSVLIALGMVTGELEFEVVAEAVAGGYPEGELSAFADVKRVVGGHWISFGLAGGVRSGRWFHPDLVQEEPSSPRTAVQRVRDAVIGAVESRALREQVTVALSGGRDSGCVAVAASLAGVRAECLTMELQPDSLPSEVDAARTLALAMRHGWRTVPIDAKVNHDDLREIPDLTGSPIGYPVFPMVAAMRNAAASTGCTVMLDGEGGDLMFAATPLAAFELARMGRLALSWRAAKAFHADWRYSYPVIAKIAGRAIMPRRVLEFRERLRPLPPWAVRRPSPTSGFAARSSRAGTVEFLCSFGGSPYLELAEQLYQRVGIRYACPLYDQRVVRTALSLPVSLLVPIPEAKPVLSTALLGEFSATRVKARQTPYFAELAENLHAGFPWLFESDSLCARQGFVRGAVRPAEGHGRWLIDTLSVVPTEMWVRRMEGGHGGR
jgi:asparagine synthetase B (glutamine-hydrolysing)